MNSTASQDRPLTDLLGIALDALKFFPPLYPQSIFGPFASWRPPHGVYSEFNVLDPADARRALGYLQRILLPGFAKAPQTYLPDALKPLFWRPSRVFQVPGWNGDVDSFPKESWFFINGVATNEVVARMNARYLVKLFHRPLTVVHNSTNSLGLDLLECAVGKAWDIMTEPALQALPEIVAALENPVKRRVIVVCHSQGTIIMANVLRALTEGPARESLSRARARLVDAGPGRRRIAPVVGVSNPKCLNKLEIYAFATCADSMCHVAESGRTRKGNPIPWLEHFGNEHDLVARLGMLALRQSNWGIRIEGGLYQRRGAWGHLLNEHYLAAIDRHLDASGNSEDPYVPMGGHDSPRLYRYAGGASPPVH